MNKAKSIYGGQGAIVGHADEAIADVAGDIFNHNTVMHQRRASNASRPESMRHLSRASSQNFGDSPAALSVPLTRENSLMAPSPREFRGYSNADSVYDPEELCRQYLIQVCAETMLVQISSFTPIFMLSIIFIGFS